MASSKPVTPKAAAGAAKSARKGKATPAPAPRGPVARVAAAARGAAQEAVAAARGMPGWRGGRTVVGEGLAAGATALLLEAREKSVAVRRRVGGAWQAPMPLAGEDAAAAFAALRKLAVTAPAGQEPEFVVSARKLPRRGCRVAARAAPKGEQVLLLIGPELPPPERPRIGRLVGSVLWRLVPPFLKRTPPPPDRDPSLPPVELAPTGPDAEARKAAVEEADGYEPACDLVAAAVRDRANLIVFEAGPQGVAVQFDIDGVATAAPELDKAEVGAIVGVLKDVAGLDRKERGPQSGKVTALVAGKSWPCTVSGRRGGAGERLEVVIDHVRPRFKSLAETGMPGAVASAVQDFLKLESGLIVLAGPHHGGLSTLFDSVISAADRLLRDFVVLEDAVAPRPEIQNVRPFRWDARTGTTPATALDAALREYPNVLACCDLDDAALAKRLVAQAAEGRLVIVGVRAADAAEGIARLLALGADPRALGHVLLGAVGVQLVRKLCPKCRTEYLPTVETVVRLRRDPEADVTLFRAAPAGCTVCTGTGYLGRTAACELAAGATLRDQVAKAVGDARLLRQAAVKDGMVGVQHDAIDKAVRGVTSIEEVQRVFRRP